MRTSLLTLAALGWAASAMAGDWKKPAVPLISFTPTESTAPEAGGEYYVFNLKAGQYLNGGNGWGTQASVDTLGCTFILEELTSTTVETEKGFGMKNQTSSKKNKYLFYDGGGYAYIDMGNQNSGHPNCNIWQFKQQADGSYTIQITPSCEQTYKPLLDAEGNPVMNGDVPANSDTIAVHGYVATEFFGWVSDATNGQTGAPSATVVRAGVDPAKAEGECGIYWMFLTKEQYTAQKAAYSQALVSYKEAMKLYDAKLALLNKMQVAEEAKVSTAAAEAVYNNAAATIDEVKAAVKKLGADITKAAIGDKFNGASVEAPVDATFLIQNPDFTDNTSASNVPGWESTFTGWQDAKSNRHDTNAVTKDSLSCPFVENWVAGPKTLADYYCRQELAALPVGAYSLEFTVVATQQSASGDEVTGANLFAILDGDSVITPCSSHLYGGAPVKVKRHFVVKADGTDVTIGFETRKTSANWVAFDGFRLSYMGTAATAEYLQMLVDLDACRPLTENVQDDDNNYTFSAATIAALDALLAKVDKVTVSTPVEEVVAIDKELLDMIALVKAEKKAYADLRALQTKVEVDATNYVDVPVVGEALGDMPDEITMALQKGSYSIKDIEDLIAKYNHLIQEELPKNITENTDLTSMLVNPNFDNNSREGWIVDPKYGDGKWTNVAAECAEMWNKDFNVYQDLKNLPTGLYEVGLQGFVRQGTFQGAFDNWLKRDETPEDIRGFIYGSTGFAKGKVTTKKTPFKSVFEGKDNEPHYGEAISGAVGGIDAKIVDGEGNEFYIPNGMTGFAEWEKLGDDRFKTTAQVLVTDGTLRIGAISEEHKDFDFWCIFDSFTLKYVSHDMYGVLLDMAESDIETLEEKKEKLLESQALPVDLVTKIGGFRETLEQLKADAAKNEEKASAFAEDVAKTIETLNSVAAEVLAITDMYNYYNDKLADYEAEHSADAAYQEAYAYFDGLYSNYEPGATVWESTEAMRAESTANAEAWSKFIIGLADVDNATLENPAEISEVIVNRGFFYNNDNSAFGWTGANGSANENEYEFYNKNFDMSQTITGLGEGFYRLEVQGFYRHGGYAEAAADTAFAGNAKLFAKVGHIIYVDSLQSIMADAPTESFGAPNEVAVEKTVDGETVSYYIPNMMDAAQAYFTYVPDDKEADEDNPNAYGFYRGNGVNFYADGVQPVTIGVYKKVAVQSDWTIFDDFQLFYLGKVAPAAIEGVENSGKAVLQQVYTIGGVKLSRPQKGVNIVVTTLSDGTKVTSKVLVK